MIATPGKVPVPDKIDWYAFLERPRLPSPSSSTLREISQQSILVTGAGGSIGGALSLRLARLGPAKLILLEASEQALYSLESDLARADIARADLNRPGPARASLRNPVTTVLGNVADPSLLEELFSQHQPTIIFHAAAHKHLPLLETQPLAAIANNALATQTLISCARRHGHARVVLLSTDKAAAPLSILGATKNLAEQLTLASHGIVLRLGNVLETEGSVVEVFQRQIASAEPLTLTHPNAERYFLTCEEAVDLLVLCAIEGIPESIYVPDLKRPQSIEALAIFLINHASSAKATVTTTTLRAGEKLSEVLWSLDESPSPTELIGNVPGCLRLNRLSRESSRLVRSISEIENAVQDRNLLHAIELLQQCVPAYKPSKTILDLMQQANQKVPAR